MGSLITLILNGLGTVVGSIFSAFYNEKTAVVQAQATTEGAAIAATASIENKWWFVAALVSLFALIFFIYDFKCVVWDTVLGWGTTKPLKGDLATVHLTVVGGLFFHSLVSRFL